MQRFLFGQTTLSFIHFVETVDDIDIMCDPYSCTEVEIHSMFYATRVSRKTAPSWDSDIYVYVNFYAFPNSELAS